MSHVMDASDDLIQPFMIELNGLRGRLIRMGPVVEDVISRHDLPEAVQGLMAEFVVLAVALSAALKFDGIFTKLVSSDFYYKIWKSTRILYSNFKSIE